MSEMGLSLLKSLQLLMSSVTVCRCVGKDWSRESTNLTPYVSCPSAMVLVAAKVYFLESTDKGVRIKFNTMITDHHFSVTMKYRRRIVMRRDFNLSNRAHEDELLQKPFQRGKHAKVAHREVAVDEWDRYRRQYARCKVLFCSFVLMMFYCVLQGGGQKSASPPHIAECRILSANADALPMQFDLGLLFPFTFSLVLLTGRGGADCRSAFRVYDAF